MLNRTLLFLCYFLFFDTLGSIAQEFPELQTVADNGWANNSVNTVIFRKNSLVTYQDTQFISYYDADQYLVLGKRKLNSKNWTILRSQYKGDAADAHKSISIMVDGKGYLHVVWSQHDNGLNYARAVKSESLVLGVKEQMLGLKENKVTYPEFYKLATGDLLFLYRDGSSGNGDLMINRYDIKKRNWTRIQDNLIDGQGKRNAYWQTVIDKKGTIHLSWVWRESPDVASNHDLCYAKSTDGGITWTKSTGSVYQLPITESNAEYTCIIPQKSELINQTSMSANELGQPIIAGYWRDKGSDIPQYHIVYHDGLAWSVQNLGFRKTPFTLSGGGTKKIPISRPQIITWKQNSLLAAALIFRDTERSNKVSVAISDDLSLNQWMIKDLTLGSVGEWEPTYDTELWKTKKRLALFIQEVVQIDGEGKADNKPAAIQVLEWKP